MSAPETPNLYEALNLARDAGPAEVRAASRRRIFDTHPDRGGDRAEHERVLLAHRVLNDPAARARYNATGATDDPEVPDRDQPRLMQTLAAALSTALAQTVQRGGDPLRVDLVAEMRRVLRERLDALAENARGGLEAQEKFVALKGRFRQAEGPNLLDLLVDGQRAQIYAQLRALAAEEEAVIAALSFLEGATFRRDRGGAWKKARAVPGLEFVVADTAASATTM